MTLTLSLILLILDGEANVALGILNGTRENSQKVNIYPIHSFLIAAMLIQDIACAYPWAWY